MEHRAGRRSHQRATGPTIHRFAHSPEYGDIPLFREDIALSIEPSVSASVGQVPRSVTADMLLDIETMKSDGLHELGYVDLELQFPAG